MAARRQGVRVSRHRKQHDPSYLQLEFAFTFPVAPTAEDPGTGKPPHRARERMHRDEPKTGLPKGAPAMEHARPARPRERMER
jgi:hypothetical protein